MAVKVRQELDVNDAEAFVRLARGDDVVNVASQESVQREILRQLHGAAACRHHQTTICHEVDESRIKAGLREVCTEGNRAPA